MRDNMFGSARWEPSSDAGWSMEAQESDIPSTSGIALNGPLVRRNRKGRLAVLLEEFGFDIKEPGVYFCWRHVPFVEMAGGRQRV